MRGGVQSINAEFQRVVQEHSGLFKRNVECSDRESRTIAQCVREIPKRSESAKQAKKQIVDLRIFLNQNKVNVTTKELNNMDYDELVMTYENVIDQVYNKYIEMQKLEKQMPK